MQDRVPKSPASIINVPTPISLSRLNDYGQQLASAYFSPAGMAAAAAAVAASAHAQATSSTPVNSAMASSAGSAVAAAAAAAVSGGLTNPAALLHHHSFFQKQQASLASPFIFPAGKSCQNWYAKRLNIDIVFCNL